MTENVSQAASTNVSTTSSGGRGLVAGLIISALLAALGIALWVVQMTQGLAATSMYNAVPWGAYIISFMFFVGLSAGSLIVSAVPRIFGIKSFYAVSKIAAWVSICCTIVAIVFVVVDLGHPDRLLGLFVSSNMTSPLMWDMIVLTIYLILSGAYLYLQIRFEKGSASEAGLRVLAVIALIGALAAHTVTAWLGSSLISTALAGGLALVIVVALLLHKGGSLELAQADATKIVKVLGIVLLVDVYLSIFELFSGSLRAEGIHDFSMLFAPIAVLFWLGLIGSALVALVALVSRLQAVALAVIFAVVAIAAGFCKCAYLLMKDFQVANIAYPDSTTIYTGITHTTNYMPSIMELGVVLGVIGLGAFMLLVGIKFLFPRAK